MNEAEIINYLSNPNTTPLNGFRFRINYPNLNQEIKSEILPEEIKKISSQYEPIYFNLIFKFSQLFNDESIIKSIFSIDYEIYKDILLKNFETQLFTFTPSKQLVILKNSILIEVIRIDESLFEIKIFSLDVPIINTIKSEISFIQLFNDSIFTVTTDASCNNSLINEIYVQDILNLLIEDYHSFQCKYSIFTGMNHQIKNILFGLIKKGNYSLHLNEDSLYIGTIALISLLIENRLANIYEIENGSYNDDKTLGQLIQDLAHHGHLTGIDTALNNFKDIRNNLIHYHRRTFNLYNSYIESIKYLGQFLIWCKNNGRL